MKGLDGAVRRVAAVVGHGPHCRGRAFSRYSLAKFDCSGNARLELEQVTVEVLF